MNATFMRGSIVRYADFEPLNSQTYGSAAFGLVTIG